MKGVARKQISFRLREDLLEVLRERAKRENRSLNNLVESLLLEAMRSKEPTSSHFRPTITPDRAKTLYKVL